MRKNYELIEHTADIGVRVKGRDLKDLFKNAALAMFEIIAERLKDVETSKTEKFSISQDAESIEELFVNWLNELLSLSATKGKIFCHFIFNSLEPTRLEVVATGCDIKGYKLNTEIKAATYHELEIRRDNSGWQAKVIFDV